MLTMRSALAALDRALALVSRLLAAAAGVAFAALAGAMIYEVVARYVFTAPTIWSTDFAMIANGAVLFLGAAWVTRRQEHIRVDVFSSLMPARLQACVDRVFHAALALPLAMMWLVSLERAVLAFERMERQVTSAWGPLLWPVHLMISLGLLALLLEVVRLALGGRRDVGGAAEKDGVHG